MVSRRAFPAPPLINKGTGKNRRFIIITTAESSQFARFLSKKTNKFLTRALEVEKHGEPILLVAFRLAGRVPYEAGRGFLARWLEGRRLANPRWKAGGYLLRQTAGGSIAGVIAIPSVLGTDAARKSLEHYGFGLDEWRTIDHEKVDVFLAQQGPSEKTSGTITRRTWPFTYGLPTTIRGRRPSVYASGAGRALIDRIHLMFCEGQSYHAIARRLESEHVKTPTTGKAITFATVAYLVRFRRVSISEGRTPDRTPHKRGGQPRQPRAAREPREPMPILF